MQQSLTLELIYPYSPERVWHALTDQRTLATWMMDNTFEPRLGHRFQFQDHSLPGLETVIDCEVIAIDAPRRLVYTWNDRWMDMPSLVTWILEPVEGGTQLQLRHSGLAPAATPFVRSPVSRLSKQLGQGAVTQATLDYAQQDHVHQSCVHQDYVHQDHACQPDIQSATQPVGETLLGVDLIGNWDYRLNHVLPTILAQSTTRQP